MNQARHIVNVGGRMSQKCTRHNHLAYGGLKK
ncbi:hypothetical protein IE970_27275 [Klebsiella michiganensis]|nr:hypothetical protein IE970_27275 [Klebsiella michiganensis]